MDHELPPSVFQRLGKARLSTRDMDELIGVCRGILADGVVNLQEAFFILQWLEDHQEIVTVWPADILYETEENELLGILLEITGVPIKVRIGPVESSANTATQLPVNEPENGVVLDGNSFCLTGKFEFGSRNQCAEAVIRCGGKVQKGVTATTDYLVVGLIGSETWAHASWGRKIEKGVYLRDSGSSIHIVSENTWMAALNAAQDIA